MKKEFRLVLVKHRILKQLVLSYFRADYPNLSDEQLLNKKTEFSTHVDVTENGVTIRSLISAIQKDGKWGYCRHLRGGVKEVHYWVTTRKISNKRKKVREFIMHELVHAAGNRDEEEACRYAKLAETAREITNDILKQK